jgi:hypothetical protein
VECCIYENKEIPLTRNLEKMGYIMNILKASFLLLGNVSSAYSGTFRSSSPEIKKIEEEMKNIDIPTAKTDRQNLRQDCNNVVKDYKKSFDNKKSNG